MREMKDSGIKFVGRIPINWSVLKNKRCFELEKNIVGKSYFEYQLLSLSKKGVVTKDINNTFGKIPDSYETYQIVKKRTNDNVFVRFRCFSSFFWCVRARWYDISSI